MAKLVDDVEMYGYLGIAADEDDPHGNALLIRDAVEDLLEQQTSQLFGPAQEIVDEMQDGEGTRIIFTNHKIDEVLAIAIRYSANDALEYYDVDILDGITFKERRIYSRTVEFPRGKDNIYISYNALANMPSIAKQAVREVVASMFRRVGSEDARSERHGSFTHVLLRSIDELPMWQRAVQALQIPVLG